MPSESDTSRKNTEPAFVFQGTGDVVRFVCPKCGHSRPNLGRRLKRYLGTRTWICGECRHLRRTLREDVRTDRPRPRLGGGESREHRSADRNEYHDPVDVFDGAVDAAMKEQK